MQIEEGKRDTLPTSGTPGLYNFRQNNSGGSFDVNDTLTILVVIEADSAEDANRRAEDLGIYFNGCASGMDCSCCGDRWSDAYGKPDFADRAELEAYLSEQKPEYNNTMMTNFDRWYSEWVERGEPAVILYLQDGTVVRYRADKGETK